MTRRIFRSVGSLMGGVLLYGVVSPAAWATADSLYYAARPAMGTTVEVYLYAAGRREADALFEAAFDEIERIEAALSTYRPASELSRVNAHAAAAPVTTDPEVFGLIERALAYSRRTAGAFDITVGRLMKAWGFFRGEGRYPSDDELAVVRAATGWRHVALDPAARSVRFLVPGLELDVGALGKGYALDRVAALLRAHHVDAALVGAGQSSYYAVGAPPGKAGWPVRVPAPFDHTRTLSTVLLRDASLSTSGNYEKFFELDGRRYCHIMDPRTGHPVEGMVQATVVAPRSEDSDALATAVFVLGPAAGAGLLEAAPGAAGLLVTGAPDRSQVVSLRWPEAVATR